MHKKAKYIDINVNGKRFNNNNKDRCQYKANKEVKKKNNKKNGQSRRRIFFFLIVVVVAAQIIYTDRIENKNITI